MKKIYINDEDFIDFLISKNILELKTTDLNHYFDEFVYHVKNKGKLNITEIKGIVDAVILPYEFKGLTKNYINNQIHFVYYTLIRKHTTIPLKEIAIYFDNKDHSTIRNGVIKFNERKDSAYYKDFKEIYDICNSYLIETRKKEA